MSFIRPYFKDVSDTELTSYFLTRPVLLFNNFNEEEITEILSLSKVKHEKYVYDILKLSIIKMYKKVTKHILLHYNIEKLHISSFGKNTPAKYLDELKQIFEQNFTTYIITNEAMESIMKYDNVELFIHISKEIDIIQTHLYTASRYGAIKIMEHLIKKNSSIEELFTYDYIDTDKLIAIDDKVFDILLTNEHFDICMKYIHDAAILSDNALISICQSLYLPLIDYIMKKIQKYQEKILCYLAASKHYKKVFDILDKYDLKLNNEFMFYACVTEDEDYIIKCKDLVTKHDRSSDEYNIIKIKFKTATSFKYYWSKKVYGIDSKEKATYLHKNVNISHQKMTEILSYEQRSEEWFDARKFVITSTNISPIIGTNPYETFNSFMQNKLWPKKISSSVIQFGTDTEKITFLITYFEACRKYILEKSCEIIEYYDTGLQLYREHPWIGASADGICNIYKGISSKKITMEFKSPSKLSFYPQCPIYYYDQFNTAQIVGNVKNAIFSVFTPEKTQINHYKFDEKYWNMFILPLLCKSYINSILPTIILKEKNLIFPPEIKPAFML